MNTVFFGVSLFLVIVYFVAFVYLARRQRMRRDAAAKLRRATLSVLRRDNSVDGAVGELEMVCNNLFKEHASQLEDRRSPADLLESLYYTHETESRVWPPLQKWLGRERLDDSQLEKLTTIIGAMRQKQPFASVSGPCRSCLDSLKKLLDEQSGEAGGSLLERLSTEIAALEGSLSTQQRHSRWALVVSGVGVILTVLFGVLALRSFLPNG